MKENADKHLDNLSRRVIGKSTLETTSFDFTATVMSEITALSSSKVTTYVPLISKRIWALICIGFTAIVLYSIFKTPENNRSWLNDINLGQIQLPNFEYGNPFSSLDVSQITVYATMLLVLMLCVQIPLLKHYFNKRLD